VYWSIDGGFSYGHPCQSRLVKPNHVNLDVLCDLFILILLFFASL